MSLKLRVLVSIALSAIVLPMTPAAHANDEPPHIGLGYQETGVGAGADKYTVDPGSGEVVTVAPGQVSTDPNQYKYELQCHLGGGDFDSVCIRDQIECHSGPQGNEEGIPVVWLSAPKGVADPVWSHHSGPTCLYDARPEDLLPRIAAQIQRQFESLPISAGTVVAQPSPNTLRGAETNFYADASEQQFDVTMLGQQVHVVATPVQYTWNYGDGTVFGHNLPWAGRCRRIAGVRRPERVTSTQTPATSKSYSLRPSKARIP
ncbi:hypothetical protein AHiyo4_09970 [Arthrobacter sp. Hiyo4]|nr:hypothetical protein AHiyo4_09970 [Arthrobacter sp. Hiyo4]